MVAGPPHLTVLDGGGEGPSGERRPYLRLKIGGEEWEAANARIWVDTCWELEEDFDGDPDEVCFDCGFEFGCHRGAEIRWPDVELELDD